MCGRLASAGTVADLLEIFAVDERRAPLLSPRWNVAPSQPVYAVVDHQRRRYLVAFNWGFLAAGASGIPSRPAVNARSETLATKPAFRQAFARRRCLIPADAFYEWRRGGGAAVPYAVRRRDGTPLALAGVWAPTTADPGAPRGCAIITTSANAVLASVHHRMPVVLEPSCWDAWLDPDADPATLADLLRPAAPDVLHRYPVAASVNDVRNDHPGLLDPVPEPATLWPEEVDLS